MEPHKRRRREADETPSADGGVDATVFPLAQNRALSTNLFRYKRRVQELEATVSEVSSERQVLLDVLSILRRRLTQIERNLLEVLSPAETSQLPDDDAQSAPALFLRNLIGFRGDSLAIEGQEALLSSVCTKIEAGAPSTEVLAVVDTNLERQGRGLLARAATIVSDLSRAASSASCVSGFDGGQSSAPHLHGRLLMAQDALDLLSNSLASWKSRCARLELEAHRANRTLERLRFDHPLLDISAHAVNPIPHGLEPARLGSDCLPLSADHDHPAATLAASATEVRGDEPAEMPESSFPTPATFPPPQKPPQTTLSLPVAEEPADGASVTTSLAVQDVNDRVARAIVPLEEEISALRDELDAMRSLASERSREIHDRDAAIANLGSELMRLKLLRVTESDVVTSPWYVYKCNELDAARERGDEAELRAEVARRGRDVLALQAAADARRVSELLNIKAEVVGDGECSAAAAAAKEAVAQAVADRDAASSRCAEATAAARLSELRKSQIDELSLLVSAMQRDQERLRSDWASRAAARATAATPPDSLASQSSVVLAAEIEGLRAENAAVIDMLERVSTEFEAASAQVARALAVAQASEAEAMRLQTVAGRAVSDRNAWLSAKAALERQCADAVAAAEAANALAANQSRLLDAQRESCAAMDARIQQLQLECTTARIDRRANPASSAHAQLGVLVQRADDAIAQANSATLQVTETDAELRRAREEISMLQRRLMKRDAKIVKLQEELASSTLAPATVPPFARAVSAASSVFGSSSGGADEAASGGGDEAVVARLKQQQLGMLQALLECSVCRKNHKDCVITKCYHLFCRECLDNNLKIRHRKCPSCGQGFGAEDVKAVYFAS